MNKQKLAISFAFAAVLGAFALALGIGDAAPSARAENAAAPKAIQTPWSIKGNKITAANFLGTKNNQPLIFKTNKIERMRIGTNGALGIGTINPAQLLHLVGANAVQRLESNQSNGIAQTEYVTDARRYYTGVFGSTAGTLAGKFYIKDDNTGQSRLVIDTNGNVGIGTNSPQAKIHTAGVGEGLRVQGTQVGDPNGAYVSWYDSSGTGIGYVGDGSSGDSDTYLTSYVGDVNLYTPAGAVLTAGANGNVGIGTPNPDSKLHIRTSNTNSGTYVLKIENTNGNLLFGVRNSGLVAFGTLTLPTTQHVCYSTDGAGTKYFSVCNSAAEYVPTIDGGKGFPETADLVSIAPSVKNPYGDTHGPFAVQKSATACDNNLLGYIVKPESGADGAKLNANYLPLAIYGYFPAKVTVENGAIKRGDPITSSSKAGYGMKATGACKIIGYALQDANADGTIQVFANFGENTASEVVALRAQVNALAQENRALQETLAEIQARLAALEQTAPLTQNTSAANDE